MKVLAADIGGTKTLLQISQVSGTRVEPLWEGRYASAGYADFESLLAAGLRDCPAAVREGVAAACFAVAGPVQGGRATVTNLPWVLEAAALAAFSRVPRVEIINDFYAVGAGIEALDERDLVTLQDAPAQTHAPRLVVGAGTGLGVAQLAWTGGHYDILPSEGGHQAFAPGDEEGIELLRYLSQRHGRVSWERVVSGPGLAQLYRFLCARAGVAESSSATADPAAITAAARAGTDQHARRALVLFMYFYGSVAGDLALAGLPFGGVYIAGGIAPKLIDELRAGDFLRGFTAKGRMTPLVSRMRVQVVMNPGAGLLGAALTAARA